MANEDKFTKTIDDEQLDEVAGGTEKEIAKDIAFLNAIGKDYGINLTEESRPKDIKQAWNTFGIAGSPNYKEGELNAYKKYHEDILITAREQRMSRQDAMIEAMRKTGKFVDLGRYL